MKSMATSMVMLRTRSVAKNTAPFRTQRAMSSWPAKSASISLPISATRRSMSCRLINVVCAIRGRILSQVSPMSVAEIGALHARYVRMSDRFKSLWTYHQFAAGVYKNFLGQALPYAVDFQKMFESIKAIGGTINAAQAAAAQAALAANEQALDRVYRQILDADARIPPSMLRRFLEKVKKQDESIIHSLIKFYLYADAVESDCRDKLDFLFTRIGEDFIAERGEYWSRDSLEFREKIIALVAILRVAAPPN